MAKNSKQKVKILCILDMLKQKTDEEHMITMPEILDKLYQDYDIEAERKSVYDDLACLEDFGYDIIKKVGKQSGYALGRRRFQLAELKLLVDAVQASKFITVKKSSDLIKKLSSLASHYEAKELEREALVKDKIKTMNESIYYNVDALHNAINSNKQISFQYGVWTVDKKLKLKKDGGKYVVSPWALAWNDENYYLIAYEKASDLVKHYRVDKMRSITVIEDRREGKEHFKNFDLSEYTSRTFGMYGGSAQKVKIKFPEKMIGPIIDRFGKDIRIVKHRGEYFVLREDIVVSDQFFGWLSGLGPGTEILEPESVVTKYKEFLKNLLSYY